MVANCCICKSHLGQQEDVTFHKLPRNENLANEWVKIISGIGIHISKTATVCSKHFDDSQFQYRIVGSAIKRFLTPNAIPTKYVTAPPCRSQSSSNCDQKPAREGKYDTEGVMVQESAREEKDDIEDVMAQESALLTKLVSDETEDENSTLSKRKNDSADNTNRKRTRVNTVRYIGDIGREDFASDEAYRVVQSYVRDSKKEIKTLKQKLRRMDTKINTMKDLTDNLRNKNMLTSQAAEFLQSSMSPAVNAILENLLSDKNINVYPPALQGFASSLLYYSTPAYEYVRSTFLKALPHPQTVRKWFRNVDFSPGISTLILDNLKKLVQENQK